MSVKEAERAALEAAVDILDTALRAELHLAWRWMAYTVQADHNIGDTRTGPYLERQGAPALYHKYMGDPRFRLYTAYKGPIAI